MFTVVYTPDTVPQSLFDQVVPKIPSLQEGWLKRQTVCYIVFFRDISEQPLGVVGLMSNDFIAQSYGVWFGMLTRERITFQELRECDQWAELIFARFEDEDLLAEVHVEDKVGLKFATHFGFVPEVTTGDRVQLRKEL